MQVKLTLRLDDRYIKLAKLYSKKTGKSVSKLVEEYFALLNDNVSVEYEDKLPPITRSLKGVLRNKKVDEKDYRKYLEDKHL